MDTELFVFFPENKESPIQTCEFTEDASVLGKDDIKECFSIILKLKHTFQYEKLYFFYDLNNVQAFCYPYLNHRHSLFNKKYVMLKLLNGMKNWRPCSEHNNSTCFLHCVNLGSNTISEIAVRKLNHPDNSLSLVDCMALVQGCSPCVVSVNDYNVVVDVLGSDEHDLYTWICNNRKPSREYNWNSKHGENGKGNWKGESRLLSSREEAKQLLKNAIGETYRGTLFCWDSKYEHYMEYKNELNDTYHSFHLEGDDEKRIPHYVKSLIDKFQKDLS